MKTTKRFTLFLLIAIAEKKVNFEPVSDEILDENYDKNLDLLMHNDELDGAIGVWSENGEVHFGKDVPISPIKLESMREIKEAKRKGKRTPKKENLRASQIKKLVEEKKNSEEN